MKVAVLGAAGGIGQALALLLKLQLPAESELSLYDIAGDDTIFVTPTKETTIKSLLEQIQTLFESSL